MNGYQLNTYSLLFPPFLPFISSSLLFLHFFPFPSADSHTPLMFHSLEPKGGSSLLHNLCPDISDVRQQFEILFYNIVTFPASIKEFARNT